MRASHVKKSDSEIGPSRQQERSSGRSEEKYDVDKEGCTGGEHAIWGA